jgi:hypothetical protein
MIKITIFLMTLILVKTTFYIIAYDPLTKQWGQAASSSGYTSFFPDRNWWQTNVKSKGMIGEQVN